MLEVSDVLKKGIIYRTFVRGVSLLSKVYREKFMTDYIVCRSFNYNVELKARIRENLQ